MQTLHSVIRRVLPCVRAHSQARQVHPLPPWKQYRRRTSSRWPRVRWHALSWHPYLPKVHQPTE